MWVHSQDIISYNKIFNNKEFGQIRTLIIDGEPWFVGKDIAEALGFKNPRQGLATNVADEDKGVHSVDTPSGTQQMTIINESGLYALIFGSKLESAKRFKHWVTSEVLPVIRQTGGYVNENSGASSLTPLLIYVNAMWFKSEDIANYLSDLL